MNEAQTSEDIEKHEYRVASYLEFMQAIDDIYQKNPYTRWLYRGVANSKWGLETSAERKIIKGKSKKLANYLKIRKIVKYLEELINKARDKRYNIEEKRDIDNISDLELLAHLQHDGAATCLLDMSKDSLISLWFACTDKKNTDGKVMMVNVSDTTKYKIINHKRLTREEEIKKFFEPSQNSQAKLPIYQWQPAHINQRIIVQKSVFLFGDTANIDPSDIWSIVIDKKSKKSILPKLNSLHGINEQHNFPDFSGFARSNAHDKPDTFEDNAKNLFLTALEYQQENDWDNALFYYSRVIKLNPKLAQAYYNRGVVKYRMDKFPEALKDFNKAIKLNHKLAKAYYNRGVIKVKMDDKDGALKDYDKAIELNPEDAEAYYNRGILKVAMDNEDGALQDYDKAIELNPEDAETFYNRGAVKISIKKFPEALQDCNRAIELNPKNAGAYHNRGFTKVKMSKFTEALQDYNQAIELNPKYAEAYNNRGIVKSKMNKFVEALQDYDKVIELNPEHAKAYGNRGIVKNILGDKAGARADYHKAHQLDSQIQIPDDYKE